MKCQYETILTKVEPNVVPKIYIFYGLYEIFFLLCYYISDPNIWPHDLDSHGDRNKGRFESVVWPQYDSTQRKYLLIGMYLLWFDFFDEKLIFLLLFI
jgi:hypothetical protein